MLSKFGGGNWNVELFADGINADHNAKDYKKTTFSALDLCFLAEVLQQDLHAWFEDGVSKGQMTRVKEKNHLQQSLLMVQR